MLDVSTKQARARFYGSSEWKAKRKEILERDNFECQDCKDEGIVTTEYDAILEIDHIKELEDYPELALNNDNLRTRCKSHHNKKHKRFEFRENKKKRKWDDEWW